MPSEPTASFLIGASGIDSEALLHQIRVNASRRTPLPLAAAALGRAQLLEEASRLEIPGRTTMTKDELAEAVAQHRGT